MIVRGSVARSAVTKAASKSEHNNARNPIKIEPVYNGIRS